MTAKKPVIVAVLVAAAAIAAYWFLVLTPKQEQGARLQQQIAAKRAELDTARREIATYEAAKASYKGNYATVTRLGKAVPVEDDVRSLMVQIDAAAGRSGVSFDTITVGADSAAATTSETPGAFTPVPFSFTFNGSYFELAGFLRRLERFVSVSNSRIDVTGRLLQLQTLSLAPGAGGFPRIQASIGATSYVIPPGQGLTGGATPAAPAASSGTTASAASDAATTPPTTTATVTGAVR